MLLAVDEGEAVAQTSYACAVGVDEMRSCPPTAATTLIPHPKDGDWRAPGLVKIIVATGTPGIPPHLSRFGREEWEWHGEAMGLSAGVQ